MIRRFYRWCINTGLSFFVNLGLTAGLREYAHVPAELSYAIALLTVFCMNFLLMRYYIFADAGSTDGSAARQLGLFAGASAGFRSCEYSLFLLLHSLLGIYYLLAVLLVQGSSFLLKFFVYGNWIFTSPRQKSTPPTE